jgi:hypothetical protein
VHPDTTSVAYGHGHLDCMQYSSRNGHLVYTDTYIYYQSGVRERSY